MIVLELLEAAAEFLVFLVDILGGAAIRAGRCLGEVLFFPTPKRCGSDADLLGQVFKGATADEQFNSAPLEFRIERSVLSLHKFQV